MTGSVVRKGVSNSCRGKHRSAVFVGESTEQAVAANFGNSDPLNRTDQSGRRHHVDGLQIRRAADKLAGKLARLFKQHIENAAGEPSVESALMSGDQGL